MVMTAAATAWSAGPFQLGVDVFAAGFTHLVAGQRVGLITNQTGRTGSGETTIDLLHRHPGVQLVALFAPEHGIRGRIPAGEAVDETIDLVTGVPIYSLYGKGDHRPPKIGLDHIDVLVYDIQDVGSRAYTYIWSMAEAMAAAAEHHKPFIVLDRPNPLGGHTVDGPVTEERWLSFIGLYPIPRVYGMTVGELARYLKYEHALNCELTVIPMAGYQRAKSWRETGLPWVPPSPNIPSPESAVTFAATGTIGTLGNVYIGIGTELAFQVIGGPWFRANWSAAQLNRCQLPGVRFLPRRLRSPSGLYAGADIDVVLIEVTDAGRFLPATTELVLLHHLQRYYAGSGKFQWPESKLNSFDKAMGTSSVRVALQQGYSARRVATGWQPALQRYLERRQRYLIYR